MRTSYCKKDCNKCKSKTVLSCKGCINTFGFSDRAIWSSCPIAYCCKENETSCSLCIVSESCPKLSRRDEIEEEKVNKIRDIADRAKKLANAFVLLPFSSLIAGFLIFLIWEFFAVAGLRTDTTEAEMVLQVYFFVGVLAMLFTDLCAAVVLRKHFDDYKTPMLIYILICVVCVPSALLVFLSDDGAVIAAITLAARPLWRILAIGAHEKLTEKIDPIISQRWHKIRIPYIISCVVPVLSPYILLMSMVEEMVLPALVGLGMLIFSVVTSIRFMALCISTRNACYRFCDTLEACGKEKEEE